MRHNYLERAGQRLHCYSSGNGCLSLVWGDSTGCCTDRKVTLSHVRALLRLKEEKYLVEREWIPAKVGGRWVLARKMKRTGVNRLNIDGQSFIYEVDHSVYQDISSLNLTVRFRRFELPGQWEWHELKNESILMVIRYFLNHESELTPIFEQYGR
jgi:hypothetical protein